MGAEADERGHAIDARGALGAGGSGAVVDVFRTVGPAPAVDAHAYVATGQVVAGTAVLASVGL